jgi:hypothetical protein
VSKTHAYTGTENPNLPHTNMSSEFPYSSVTSCMIYVPAILS